MRQEAIKFSINDSLIPNQILIYYSETEKSKNSKDIKTTFPIKSDKH